MGRIWALALGLILALFVVFLSGPLGGPTTQLTAALCVGGGAAASYLGSQEHMLARGVWVLVGVLFGAIGFVLGAGVFPDTMVGLFLGGVVPITLVALATMWTRRQTDFLAGVLGAGALTGVYATRFNTDPQSLNYSLPIGIGQTLWPLALGFIAGVLVQWLTTSDEEHAAQRAAEPADDADEGAGRTAPTDAVEVAQ